MVAKTQDLGRNGGLQSPGFGILQLCVDSRAASHYVTTNCILRINDFRIEVSV